MNEIGQEFSQLSILLQIVRRDLREWDTLKKNLVIFMEDQNIL